MDGLFGFLFKRKSKLLRAFDKAIDAGNEEVKRFLGSLSGDEFQKLFTECEEWEEDQDSQIAMATIRRVIEQNGWTYVLKRPIGFSDD